MYRYLCDEALDTEALREALTLRVDGAEEVKKEMREDIAEDKRKLKVWHAHSTIPVCFCLRHYEIQLLYLVKHLYVTTCGCSKNINIWWTPEHLLMLPSLAWTMRFTGSCHT